MYVAAQMRHFAQSPGPPIDVTAVVKTDGQARLLEALEPTRRLIARIVRDGVYEGAFRGIDADLEAMLVISTCCVFRRPVAVHTLPPDEASAQALDFLLHGLGMDAPTG